MGLQPTKESIYSNHTILAPDGEVLCRASAKKTSWYLDRGLATVVSWEPVVIQLKFEPNGRGHQDDEFYLGDKEDRCVRCGCSNDLTMHHIVPRCFRRFFPEEVKSHDFHDVMPLCVECHELYENKAKTLKNTICKEYNVNPQQIMTDEERELHHVFGYAKAIRDFKDVIPPDRLTWLENKVKDYLAKNNLAGESLEELAKKGRKDVREHFGQQIVERLDSLQDFVVRWRTHFLAVMEPKYMPAGWEVNRKIRLDNTEASC